MLPRKKQGGGIKSSLFVRNFIGQLLVEFMIRSKNLILIPILAKELGAADYGIYNIMINFIALGSCIIPLGLQSAVARFIPSCKSNVGKINFLKKIITLNLIHIFIFFILLNFYNLTVNNNYFTKLLYGNNLNLIFTAACCLGIKNILLLFLKTNLEIKKYYILSIIDSIVSLIVIIFIIFHTNNKSDIYINIIKTLAIIDLSIILFSSFLIKIKNDTIIESLEIFCKKEIYTYSIPVFISGLLMWSINSIDKYLINYFLGAKQTGIYSYCYSIGSIPVIFIATPFFGILPILVFRADQDIMKIKSIINGFFKLFSYTCMPACIFLLIRSDFLVNLIKNKDYSSSANQIAGIIGLSYFIMFIGDFCAISFSLHKKTKITLYILIIGSLSNILFNVLLIPQMGIEGSAYANLISFSIISLINISWAKRSRISYVDFSIFGKCTLVCLTLTTIYICLAYNLNAFGSLIELMIILSLLIIYSRILISYNVFDKSTFIEEKV